MSCSTCDDLRRQLREAREEIEAWEAGAREEAAVDLDGERLARWRRRLRASPAVCLTLMALAARPGKLTTKASIIAATRSAPGLERGRELGDNLAGTYICLGRKALRRQLFAVQVQTVWGQGWMMHPVSAAHLCKSMGDDT